MSYHEFQISHGAKWLILIYNNMDFVLTQWGQVNIQQINILNTEHNKNWISWN